MRLFTMFLACVAISAVAADTAAAQAQFARPRTIAVAWPAPVGHFQPRARDIPSEIPHSASQPEQESSDREFDQKLQICRGC